MLLNLEKEGVDVPSIKNIRNYVEKKFLPAWIKSNGGWLH